MHREWDRARKGRLQGKGWGRKEVLGKREDRKEKGEWV